MIEINSIPLWAWCVAGVLWYVLGQHGGRMWTWCCRKPSMSPEMIKQWANTAPVPCVRPAKPPPVAMPPCAPPDSGMRLLATRFEVTGGRPAKWTARDEFDPGEPFQGRLEAVTSGAVDNEAIQGLMSGAYELRVVEKE